MIDLKEKISTALLGGIKELHRVQKDLDNKYRITPLEFWKTSLQVITTNAQLIKAFVDGIPEKEAIDKNGVVQVMNELQEAFEHSEKMIIVFSTDRNKN